MCEETNTSKVVVCNMKINWDKEYNHLRIINSLIKRRLNVEPYWFSPRKKLPEDYQKLLLKIHKYLYRAEEYVNSQY